MRYHRHTINLILLSAILVCGIFLMVFWTQPQPGGRTASDSTAVSSGEPFHTAAEFGLQTVHSSVDFNDNGADDYTDFLLGARKDAENKPKYDSSYYQGGYPPEDSGACTDVVWRAFQYAGYCLKDMVDRDIAENRSCYPNIREKPDPNIDFRRVANLKVYFERHAVSLTKDPSQIAEWQPGDIVTFGTNHIGILSDRRNRDGTPYLIHNAGQPDREEDALTRCGTISGHFRFDAGKLKKAELIPCDGSNTPTPPSAGN